MKLPNIKSLLAFNEYKRQIVLALLNNTETWVIKFNDAEALFDTFGFDPDDYDLETISGQAELQRDVLAEQVDEMALVIARKTMDSSILTLMEVENETDS